MSALTFDFPQPLAEKYRPHRIADFLGLDKAKKVLSAFCARPCDAAWLFTGPPGVGKSCMALAMAEAIGAELHKIPSQKCTVQNVEDVVRACWYVPLAGGFHLVLVDEADQMTPQAQLSLLSKLDSTDPPPKTIFVFTANDTERLEKRFLSRCRVLEFSSYGMRSDLGAFLNDVWHREGGNGNGPDFERVAKDNCNNVRAALMALEIELLAA